MNQQRITFPSGDLKLGNVLHLPEGDGTSPCVVVRHPHPLLISVAGGYFGFGN